MTNLILGTILGFLLSASMAIIDGIRVRRNYKKTLQELRNNNEELRSQIKGSETILKRKHEDISSYLKESLKTHYNLADLMLTDNLPEDKTDYANMLQGEAVKIKFDKEKVLKLIDQITKY